MSRGLGEYQTNCDVGYFDFAVRYFRYADYLIASEREVGGYKPDDPATFNEWIANAHDENLHRFWKNTNTTGQAINAIVEARKAVWEGARNSIRATGSEQSIAVYKLNELNGVVRELKKLDDPRPAHYISRLTFDIHAHADDIATYAYNTKNQDLIAAVERFRFLYASTRNLISWTKNTNGLGLMEYSPVLSAYLAASDKVELDCLFDWGEDNYATILSPLRKTSANSVPYYYRHYDKSNTYLGVSSADGHLYFLDSARVMTDLGPASTWVSKAGCR